MNVLRSIARATAHALGSEWEIGLQSAEGTFSRPYCRVAASTPINSRPHGSSHRDLTRGFSVIAHPTNFSATPESALSEAARVERLLLDGFTRGLHTAAFHAGRAHPMRLPLFDYAGVAFGAPASDVIGWLHIIDASVGVIGDPADETAFVVVADLRVSWNEALGLDSGPPVLTVGIEAGP